MIIRIITVNDIHISRSFNKEAIALTKGGELAKKVKGIMDLKGTIDYELSNICDAQLITGPYKDMWVCLGSRDFRLGSPLEQLAEQAE
jgi:hypothetical protein